MKLTKKKIQRATYQGRKYTGKDGKPRYSRYVLWDDAIPGFGLRITGGGRKSFILSYRINGRKKLMTLGKFGPLTLDEARKKAHLTLAKVLEGEDPLKKRKKKRREQVNAKTVNDLCDLYMELHAPKKKPSSVRSDKSLIKCHIRPGLGSHRVDKVTQEHVARLHLSARSTPYQANRVLALLSTMFNLAEQWGIRPRGTNPCQDVKRFKEKKRERYLSTEELSRLGEVLDQSDEFPVAILAIRLLLLTGARKGEILKLKWDEVDFERSRLRLTDSKTGEKTIPLSAPALKLLKETPRIERNPYVCAGRREGKHFVGLGYIWRRLRAQANLEDVRIHDLRHSFASIGAGGGLSLPVIGALLGHTQAQTTARYAHLADNPLKEAADLIGQEIAAHLNGGKEASEQQS